MTQPRRAAFALIFITVVLDVLALGMIIPVLPNIVVGFTGDTVKAAAVYGVFGTTWALMQFVVSPILGALSDRFGRRGIILLSNFGLGLDYVLMALAPNLGWLFAGRVISGITAASIPTAGAYIADITAPHERAAKFGMLGGAFGLGFVLGPALGGVLGSVDPRLPFWVAAGLSLMNGLYGTFVLPESLAPERRSPFSWRRANPVGSLKLLGSHRELLGLAAVIFLGYLAHEVLPATFVLYAGYRYGWHEREVGLTLALVGIGSAVVQAGLVRPAVARLGERRTLMLGLLFGALGFALYGAAPSGALFLAGVPLMSLWGLSGASAQGLATRRVGLDQQGQLQGALSSIRGISGLMGPMLFTTAFSTFIDERAAVRVPGASFYLAAALLFAALSLGWLITRRFVEPAPSVAD